MWWQTSNLGAKYLCKCIVYGNYNEQNVFINKFQHYQFIYLSRYLPHKYTKMPVSFVRPLANYCILSLARSLSFVSRPIHLSQSAIEHYLRAGTILRSHFIIKRIHKMEVTSIFATFLLFAATSFYRISLFYFLWYSVYWMTKSSQHYNLKKAQTHTQCSLLFLFLRWLSLPLSFLW